MGSALNCPYCLQAFNSGGDNICSPPGTAVDMLSLVLCSTVTPLTSVKLRWHKTGAME